MSTLASELQRPVTAVAGQSSAAAGGRDLRIDFLRGLAEIILIVDHIGGASLLWLLTGTEAFFTSAAAAFVLIPGVVAGIMYRRVAARDGLGQALRRLLATAWLEPRFPDSATANAGLQVGSSALIWAAIGYRGLPTRAGWRRP